MNTQYSSLASYSNSLSSACQSTGNETAIQKGAAILTPLNLQIAEKEEDEKKEETQAEKSIQQLSPDQPERTFLGKALYTIHEIVQHVVCKKSYECHCVANYNDTSAYKLLVTTTPKDVVEQVRKYVTGDLPLNDIAKHIDQQSAYHFLAAAKIIDFDMCDSARKLSTFDIRKIALFQSKAEKNGRAAINMINAFSMPPQDLEKRDIMLLNEIDNSPPFIKSASEPERDKVSRRAYTYCQKEAAIIPEMVPVIESVIRERVQTMLEMDRALPKETAVVFKGCAGSGKSYAQKELMKKLNMQFSVDDAVQSTDNIKNHIKAKTGNIFTDQHLHLLGSSIALTLAATMKSCYPKLSTIQEGWFRSADTIDKLFMDLKKADLKLEMHDFDGDYAALCLRVLARYQDPNSPRPPMDGMERGFRFCRAARNQLLKSIRPKIDTYQFRFVDVEGIVHEDIKPETLSSSADKITEEIEKAKKTQITKKHVDVFGKFLQPFIGMTIEEAFKNANLAEASKTT